MFARASVIMLVIGGCGGAYPGAHTPANAAGSATKGGLENAGLPYHVLDRTGHQLDEAAFWQQLAAARVVCVGEEHTNPHHHWVQLQVVKRLTKTWPHLVLGMEMFQRPFQAVLDDFAAGRIDADALRSRTGWEDRWGYDYKLYGPTIATAVAAHGGLIALNAPKELTRKVAHHGLASLTPDERAQVPELDLHDVAHRAWFDALMEDMGGSTAHAKAVGAAPSTSPGTGAPAPQSPPPATNTTPAAPPASGSVDDKGPGTGEPTEAEEPGPNADDIYTVQVMWDETMADTTARWLAAHPADRVVILAGTGHCMDTAIVHRLARRGVTGVVSVRSVIDDGEGSVAEVLAKPMNDFVVVLDLPPEIKAKMREAAKSGE
jgi:uncharacterized iron-regulated protein